MKLSIVIPIYNAEKYIEECLAHILLELDNNVELLLLDDGSKDASYDMIQKYRKSNIRVFHHENHGVSYTRNRGIQESTGDYIMFVDADDKLSAGWKETLLKDCDGKNDVIYYSKDIAAYGAEIRKIDIVHSIFGIADAGNLGNMSSPWSKLYRREFLRQERISFDEGLINGEDALFNLTVLLKSSSYSCRSESFYQYRIYTGSSSRRFSEKFFDSNLRYFSLTERLLYEEGLEEYEIGRCMAYSVVYSVYLYLFLTSFLDEQGKREKALGRIAEFRNGCYMKKYPTSKDCNKVIQVIYCLVRNNRVDIAMLLVKLRNAIRKQQRNETKWEFI